MREISLTQYVEMPDSALASRIQELEQWLVTDYVKLIGHIEMCETLAIEPFHTRRAVAEQRYRVEQELRVLTKQPKLPRYKTFIEL